VLFAWFARAETPACIVKIITGEACNECKTLGRLGLDWVKILGHGSSFPNRRFLVSDRINNERSQEVTAKPVIAVPEFVMLPLT